MESLLSASQETLVEYLDLNGYNSNHLTLLGFGAEGAVFSNKTHIFKFFFMGHMTFPDNRLEFISQTFLKNKKIFGVRTLSDIICDEKTVIFVTPYEEYFPYAGENVEEILAILADSKKNNYIFTNFHPKNIMYDSSKNLKIVDLGRSLAPFTDDGYQNMVYRAYLTTYFYHRPDLTELMSSLHQSEFLKELDKIDIFIALLERNLKNILSNNF